jgi:hypothetical protein
MMSCTGQHPDNAWRALRVALAAWALAAGLAPLAAHAQQPAKPGDTSGALPPDMMKQLEASGAPLGDSMARLKRMSDPNAGKRDGDDKLSCDQIRAEFEDTRRKHAIQTEKQKAAKTAVEADAVKAQAENSGPGAVASGFFGGLAAVGAHAIGAGDAFNEKLKADLIAKQNQRQAQQSQFAEEAEATKALSDRGRTLMSLGQAKACTGLVYKP